MKMKKIPLLCTLLISFLGTACDKETDNDIDLSGSWQLISQISNDEEQELDEFIVFDLFFVFCLKSKTHLCGRSGHLVIPFLP